MKRVILLKSRAQMQGGLEKQTHHISRAFSERGYEVTLLTTGIHSSPKIQAFDIKGWPSFRRIERFDQAVQSWLLKNQAEIVFGMDRNRIQTHIRAGNGVHSAYLESRIRAEGKIKGWMNFVNPLHRKLLEIEKAGFENPKLKRLFTNSQMVRNEILERYRVDPNKIEVIHNGVEWNEMENDFLSWEDGKIKACRQFNLDPNQFHFLFIGNGYLRKGLDRLMEALAQLTDKEIHLSVIGKEKRIDYYREKARRLGLSARFFGPQESVRPFYQIADVLAIPSFYDPFANVTVEALAMGLFVLSSRHNGGSEILNPQNGIVINDLWNQEEILSSLKEALKNPKTKHSSLLSRKSVEYLDFSKQMKRLIDACE